MPLEGFQLFCDRNDHFPSVFLQFTIAGNLEPIHPATEKKNFVQNSGQGVFTFAMTT